MDLAVDHNNLLFVHIPENEKKRKRYTVELYKYASTTNLLPNSCFGDFRLCFYYCVETMRGRNDHDQPVDLCIANAKPSEFWKEVKEKTKGRKFRQTAILRWTFT